MGERSVNLISLFCCHLAPQRAAVAAYTFLPTVHLTHAATQSPEDGKLLSPPSSFISNKHSTRTIHGPAAIAQTPPGLKELQRHMHVCTIVRAARSDAETGRESFLRCRTEPRYEEVRGHSDFFFNAWCSLLRPRMIQEGPAAGYKSVCGLPMKRTQSRQRTEPAGT